MSKNSAKINPIVRIVFAKFSLLPQKEVPAANRTEDIFHWNHRSLVYEDLVEIFPVCT